MLASKLFCLICASLFSLALSRPASADTGDLSPIISPQSIRAHHQVLVDISSAAGGLDSGVRLNDAGASVARYMRDGYKKAGLKNVRLEPFYPNRWWPKKYSISVLGPGSEETALVSFPIWYSAGAENLELEVVYAGYGTVGELRDLDVNGKAVLIDMKRLLHFVPSWKPQLTDAMNRLKERGAAAIIAAETRIDSPTGAIVGDAGTIKDGRSSPAILFPVPAFSIGKSGGRKLKARIAQGSTRVRLNLDYSLEQVRSHNVVAELPGNGKIDEYIIIGGHYDSWFTGAIDNLGSQASLIEMARHFASIPQEKRDRHILFVSLFGHELTNHSMGHAAFVENRAPILGKITTFLNIDGSGSWGWEEIGDSGQIAETGREDKGGIVATSQALSALAFNSVYSHYRDTPATWMQFPLNLFVSDQHENIGEAGIPSLLIINKHIYYHSPFDTIDRIAPEHVHRRTMINIEVAEKLLASKAGYYIGIDTNPHKLTSADNLADLSPNDLPHNPVPWQGTGPGKLDMHIIPSNVQVFSPVIAWPGFWTADGITRTNDFSWNFGGILGLFGQKHGIFSGSMYFFPGEKTITMSITDNQGRVGTVQRKIRVSAGPYQVFYWIAGLLLLALFLFTIFRIVRVRRQKIVNV